MYHTYCLPTLTGQTQSICVIRSNNSLTVIPDPVPEFYNQPGDSHDFGNRMHKALKQNVLVVGSDPPTGDICTCQAYLLRQM